MLTFSENPESAEQQMRAIIFYLTAFAYIDGDFDLSEKIFIKHYISRLVEKRADDALPDGTEVEVRNDVIRRFVTHFHEVFDEIDADIRMLFDEVVAEDEKVEQFVYAKLKLRSYEIFQSFDRHSQRQLLATVEELINADGSVHPAEAQFRDEILELLESKPDPSISAAISAATVPVAATPIAEVVAGIASNDPKDIEIADSVTLRSRESNHPFFSSEEHYSADPIRLRRQAAADHELILRCMDEFNRQREAGKGKLAKKKTVDEFNGQAPFLDGHTYVHPVGSNQKSNQKYELLVLGDLHGCYSCLKAALMQADFFAKVEAFRLDPIHQPNIKVVLLGDYIDRGKFSYNGVLRTVLQLFLSAPEHVYVLRGNHEYYLEYNGRIYGGVRPAEAINTLIHHMPQEMFEAYMMLFESMPNVLLFGKIMFVHAGIPRDKDIRDKFVGLSSFNDSDLRFQMLWSDPSSADYIPDELQAQNARFPFGQLQFERFMQIIGCTTLIRGHEKCARALGQSIPKATSSFSIYSRQEALPIMTSPLTQATAMSLRWP